MKNAQLLFAVATTSLLAGCNSENTGSGSASAEKKSTAKPAGSTAGSSDSKSCCKGLNECKGKGRCKTDANSCAGKNECKGKGGCSMGCK
ncbi:MAG: hypothetical protein U0271_07950 [Polyangiaceae bacterium]